MHEREMKEAKARYQAEQLQVPRTPTLCVHPSVTVPESALPKSAPARLPQATSRQSDAHEQAQRIQEETDALQKKLADRKSERARQDKERAERREKDREAAEHEATDDMLSYPQFHPILTLFQPHLKADDMLSAMRAKQAKLRSETKKMHDELNSLHMEMSPRSGLPHLNPT